MTASVTLQKGAYSSAASRTPPKPLGKVGKALEAQEALKKKQVSPGTLSEGRGCARLPLCLTAPLLCCQEALKLQQDMRKKKQEMVEKQIECQKVSV